MQRIEDGQLIVSCDFCGRDWDGAFAAIEGHRGSILCLECLKAALGGLAPAAEVFSCVLCLREKISAGTKRWSHENRPGTFACESCVMQAADVFDRDADIDWKWQGRPGKK
jgi:hypothetical protein